MKFKSEVFLYSCPEIGFSSLPIFEEGKNSLQNSCITQGVLFHTTKYINGRHLGSTEVKDWYFFPLCLITLPEFASLDIKFCENTSFKEIPAASRFETF